MQPKNKFESQGESIQDSCKTNNYQDDENEAEGFRSFFDSSEILFPNQENDSTMHQISSQNN